MRGWELRRTQPQAAGPLSHHPTHGPPLEGLQASFCSKTAARKQESLLTARPGTALPHPSGESQPRSSPISLQVSQWVNLDPESRTQRCCIS